VQKHVAVLELAGLITKEQCGREQLVPTERVAVGRARRVLDELETPSVAMLHMSRSSTPRPGVDRAIATENHG
jgi:hypothetical protein